jgi:hypothetical protein
MFSFVFEVLFTQRVFSGGVEDVENTMDILHFENQGKHVNTVKSSTPVTWA